MTFILLNYILMQHFLMMMFPLQSRACPEQCMIWALCQHQTRKVCLPFIKMTFTSSLLKTEISFGKSVLWRLKSVDPLLLPFKCNQHFMMKYILFGSHEWIKANYRTLAKIREGLFQSHAIFGRDNHTVFNRSTGSVSKARGLDYRKNKLS